MTEPSPQAVRVDLLPCPFCGSADIFVQPDERGSGGQWVSPVHVGCNAQTGCGAGHAIGDTVEEASAAWNRRASPALAAETGGEAVRIVACHLPSTDCSDTVCLPITMTAGDLRTVYAALSAPPAAGGGLDREAVARILDSGVIHYRADSCRITDLNGTLLPEKYASMEKAASALIKLRTAAILALTVPEAKPEGEEAVETISDLILKHAMTKSGEKVAPREAVTAAMAIYDRFLSTPSPDADRVREIWRPMSEVPRNGTRISNRL